MAPGIVDLLEVIEVEHQHTHRLAIAHAHGQVAAGLRQPGAAIEGARQAIDGGQAFELAGGLIAVGQQQCRQRQHHGDVRYQRKHHVDHVRGKKIGELLGVERSQHAAPAGDDHLRQQRNYQQPAPAAHAHLRPAAQRHHHHGDLQRQQAVGPAHPERITVVANAITNREQHRHDHRSTYLDCAPAPQIESGSVERHAAGNGGHRQRGQRAVEQAERRDHASDQQQDPAHRVQAHPGLGIARGPVHLPHKIGQRDRHDCQIQCHGDEQ